jgi:hypothetical protein
MRSEKRSGLIDAFQRDARPRDDKGYQRLKVVQPVPVVEVREGDRINYNV